MLTSSSAIASGSETTAVFAAGIIQGLALVTFPAVGTIFTSLVAVLVVGLLIFSARLPLRTLGIESSARGKKTRVTIPARFWVLASFALLYGIVETMNGNWAALYMTTYMGASATLASLALTSFWAMVMVGLVLFAVIEKRFSERRTYHLLPFVIAAAFLMLAFLQPGSPYLGILAFALAGLGCSALLPLTISFGQAELLVMATSVAGGLIALYQIGYGIAAFGVGAIEDDTGLGLNKLFGLAVFVALAMAVLSFVVVPRAVASGAKTE